MKNFILLTILMNSITAFAAPGFYNVQDSRLPSALQQASSSVFEIKTAFIEDFDNYSDVEVLDLSGPNRLATIARLPSLFPDKRDRAIYRAFIDHCQSDEDTKSCPIPKKISSGSGFLAGSGNTLWTNAHVMEKTVKMRATMNETTPEAILKTKHKFPMFLFDKNGNMVFNGLENEISFKVLPKQTELTKREQNTFYSVDSDYLAIDLPTTLGTPLRISRNPQQAVAVMGYPACTGCQAPEGGDPNEYVSRGQGIDAEDCIEKVTGGNILPLNVWGQLNEINREALSLIDQWTFFGYDADSQHGMSGGPVLNMNGEVVGIHAGGKSMNVNGRIQRTSRGVRPPEFNQ